jgi:hypothetical protein
MRSLKNGMCHKKKIPKNIFVPRDIVPEYEYGSNVVHHHQYEVVRVKIERNKRGFFG